MSVFDSIKAPVTSYSGRDTYKHVEPIMRRAKTLLVVSPYIDAHYAGFLKSHSRGKKVYVISSSPDAAVKKSVGKARSVRKPVTFSLIVLVVDYLLFTAGVLSSWIILASLAVLAVIILLGFRKGGDIQMKIPSSFVHAKMYIADDEAAVGSANLTFSGMHRNIEHIEITRDSKRVAELKQQFWDMWGKG